MIPENAIDWVGDKITGLFGGKTIEDQEKINKETEEKLRKSLEDKRKVMEQQKKSISDGNLIQENSGIIPKLPEQSVLTNLQTNEPTLGDVTNKIADSKAVKFFGNVLSSAEEKMSRVTTLALRQDTANTILGEKERLSFARQGSIENQVGINPGTLNPTQVNNAINLAKVSDQKLPSNPSPIIPQNAPRSQNISKRNNTFSNISLGDLILSGESGGNYNTYNQGVRT